MKVPSTPIALKDGRRIELRSPVQNEARLLLDHLRITATESYRNLNQPPEFWNQVTIVEQEKSVADFESSPSQFTLCAFSEGKIVGGLGWFAMGGPFLKHNARIGMSIQKVFAGSGLGTAMMARALEFGRQQGFVRVELTVRTYNRSGIALYEKMGFEKVGRLKKAAFIDQEYVDEDIYQLLLEGSDQSAGRRFKSPGDKGRAHGHHGSMKNLILLALSFPLLAFATSPKDFESPQKLSELWENEVVDFQPQKKSDPLNWTGLLYDASSKKCYDLVQKNMQNAVTVKEAKCDAAFVKRVTEPSEKISDFEAYKAKLLKCLESKEPTCLRRFISKRMQISFGVDGFQDRRDLVVERWKKEDFKKLHDLIQQGTVGEGTSRTFPPSPDRQGTGLRGAFKLENGAWLLKSYLGGD